MTELLYSIDSVDEDRKKNEFMDRVKKHIGKTQNNKHSIWYHIYRLHLYTTKSEALFKAGALLISWFGGVWHQTTSAAYYLFSIAIIMEYAIQLIQAKKFIPKLLPAILVISNLVVWGFATGQLIQNTATTFKFQFAFEVITIFVIGIDAVLTLLIEPPEECKIETNLKTYIVSPTAT